MKQNAFYAVAPRKYQRTTAPPQAELTAKAVPDCTFPTDNNLGIPILDITLQAEFAHMPFRLWGTLSQAKAFKGTWHFYRDDSGFNAIWRHPYRVVNTRCLAICEPNFSCYENMPLAVAAYQIYRKRWLARYWQHYGIKVFVDLNVAERFRHFNLLGVPKDWRSFCTRAYKERLSDLEAEFDHVATHVGTDRIQFVVYSGGKDAQKLCGKRGWMWFPDEWDRAKTEAPENFNNPRVSVDMEGTK